MVMTMTMTMAITIEKCGVCNAFPDHIMVDNVVTVQMTEQFALGLSTRPERTSVAIRNYLVF